MGNWYDALTARLGAVDGHAMFYLKGGAAAVREQTGVVDNGLPVTINTTTTKTQTGFAAGGGIEYGIDMHWSVKGGISVPGRSEEHPELRAGRRFPRGNHRLHHHAHAWNPNHHARPELPLPLKTERSNRVIAASTEQAPDGSGACCFLPSRLQVQPPPGLS